MAAKRDFSDPVALNWTQDGTDVDFGSLTRQLIGYAAQRGMTTLFGHEVRDLHQESDGSWTVKVAQPAHRREAQDQRQVRVRRRRRRRLPLLQKSGIKEAKGFGGFPVGGEFLRTDNPALTAAHQAKVYGLPPLGAPPMSVPHLDTRVINGQVVAAVRPVRRLVAEVPQAGQGHRPAVVGQAQQPGLDARRRAHRDGPGQVPGRPAAAQRGRPGRRRCASSRPAQSIPTGSSTSPASACR